MYRLLLLTLVLCACEGTPDVKEFVHQYNADNEKKLIALASWLDHASFADTGYYIFSTKSRVPLFEYDDSTGPGSFFHPPDSLAAFGELYDDLEIENMGKGREDTYYWLNAQTFYMPYKRCTIYLLANYKPGDQFPFAQKDTMIENSSSPVDNEHFFIINPRIAYRVRNE